VHEHVHRSAARWLGNMVFPRFDHQRLPDLVWQLLGEDDHVAVKAIQQPSAGKIAGIQVVSTCRAYSIDPLLSKLTSGPVEAIASAKDCVAVRQSIR